MGCYTDDGYSGTNFVRPGVAALFKAVRKLSVDCIVVKDFSRFSRDYIELGTCLDQIFPFMGIRFISVNDDYDSGRTGGMEGIDIPFRNLLYDLYSKDLSVKVKTSLAVKKREGQFVSAGVPFGYRKAPGDKHSLIIEEKEAQIVRRIFAMACEGMSSLQIARRFNQDGVKTPAAFRKEEGAFCREPKGGSFLWSSSGVSHILENQVYAGDMVYSKYEKETAGGKNRLKPREEWKVFRDHHEPLVSREMFHKIRESRGGRRAAGAGRRHPLTGKLVCGACKRNLRIRKAKNFYFCCEHCGSGAGQCGKRLDGAFAERYVLGEIQKRAGEVLDFDSVWEKRNREIAGQLAGLKKKKEGIRRELAGIRREKLAVYERFAGQPEEVDELKRRERDFDQKAGELEGALAKAQDELERLQKEAKKERGLDAVLSYLGLDALTGELAAQWIKEIRMEDGRLDIIWKEPDF